MRVLMTMIFKRYGLQQFTQQFYNILYDILEMAGQDYIKSLSQILKIFREFLKNPCKYFRMAFETCCSWCWVPGCCCSLRRKFISELNEYHSPKWKCYFRNGIMVIRYCKIVLQHKDTILDWGQGEKVLNETCSPKKGEFLNTSCTLAKTL